jgi:hypothetical protein
MFGQSTRRGAVGDALGQLSVTAIEMVSAAGPDHLRAPALKTWTGTVIFFRAIKALDQSRVDPSHIRPAVQGRVARPGPQPSSHANLEISAAGIAEKGDLNDLTAEFGWKPVEGEGQHICSEGVTDQYNPRWPPTGLVGRKDSSEVLRQGLRSLGLPEVA